MPWPKSVILSRANLQFRDEQQLKRVLPMDATWRAILKTSKLSPVTTVRGSHRMVKIVWLGRGPDLPLLVIVWGSDEFIRVSELERAGRRSHTKPPSR